MNAVGVEVGVDVELREATAADVARLLDELVALERQLFGDEAWGCTALLELTGTAGRRTSLALADGHLVGYALTGLVGDFSELLRIGTSPAAQRTGVASALLASAVAASADDGADRMLLEVSEHNTPARGFYARHGFTEIDRRRRYYRDGTDALVLQRELGQRPGPSGRMDP